jgi:putative DNA primase/helicase
MNPALENILSRLQKVKKVGNGWQACCPAHADRDPSLRIDEGKDGRVLLKCFAGCDTKDIVAALGLRMTDLFPRPQPPGDRDQKTYYNYKDADGKLLFRVVRTPDKKFFQQRPDNNGGWVNGLGGVQAGAVSATGSNKGRGSR